MSFEDQLKKISIALQKSGFLESEKPLPIAVTVDFMRGLEKFIDAPPGKEVRRVINAFRSLNEKIFSQTSSSDELSGEAKILIRFFLASHGCKIV